MNAISTQDGIKKTKVTLKTQNGKGETSKKTAKIAKQVTKLDDFFVKNIW